MYTVPARVMTPSMLLRAYLTEARYEFIRTLRMPGFAGPLLLVPVALYLLFGVVLFGDALRKDAVASLSVFLAFCVMGVMGPPMFGFGAFVATEREQGLVKLKRALPTPPASYLLAKTAMAVLFSVLIIMSTTFAAITIGRLRLSFGHMLAIGLVSVTGALPFCAMGLLIGTLASGKSAAAFVNLLYLPMIYLSGFFFPLPPSIRWIQFLSPAYYVFHLAMGAGGAARPGAGIDIAVLTSVTLLFGVLAIRRFARVG